MNDFTVELVWTKIQIAVTALGGWLGYFLGGIDGLMIALLVFMALDYITGVMCAIIDKKLSSAVGFKGICKLYELSHNLQMPLKPTAELKRLSTMAHMTPVM